MRSASKNKAIILILGLLFFTILAFGLITPRLSLLSILSENSTIDVSLYDVYLADYSDDDETGMKRFTIKILIGVKNLDKTQKLIIPRLSINMGYLGKPVGRAWTTEELILQPHISDDSDYVGLLPVYVSLYVDEEKSGKGGLTEFMAGMISQKPKPIEIDLTVFLGDIPINVDTTLGKLLSLLGDTFDSSMMDISMLFSVLGVDPSGIKYTIPENFIFLKNNTFANDVRALYNLNNMTIFRGTNEILIFGADKTFNKIYWENATNGNYAKGNGNYTWQYWNGTWQDLPTQPPFNNFSQSEVITFSVPPDWKKKKIVTFFPEYYYLQCIADDLDTGINTTAEEPKLMRMNVQNSYIANYEPMGNYTPPESDFVDLEFPELPAHKIPLDKGLLRATKDEDPDLNEYFLSNGLDFNELTEEKIYPYIKKGSNKITQTAYVNLTDDDDLENMELEGILDFIMSFITSHNVDLNKFLGDCEIDFIEILKYFGDKELGFKGWSNPNGIDRITGEDIYAPIYETTRYQNLIVFSIFLFVFIIICATIIVPYFAQKKIDQSFIFKDIKNLDSYIDKVKSEMEREITEDEIAFLKSAPKRKGY